MQDTMNHLSRAEIIAAIVIGKYNEFGLFPKECFEGIARGLQLLPCSLETLSDTQIVDIVGRLISVHAQASRYAQIKHDVEDPTVVKMTKFVIEYLGE